MLDDTLGQEKLERMIQVPAKRYLEVVVDDDVFDVWYTLDIPYGDWIRGPSDYSIDSVSLNGQSCFWESLQPDYRAEIRSEIERAHRCPVQS